MGRDSSVEETLNWNVRVELKKQSKLTAWVGIRIEEITLHHANIFVRCALNALLPLVKQFVNSVDLTTECLWERVEVAATSTAIVNGIDNGEQATAKWAVQFDCCHLVDVGEGWRCRCGILGLRFCGCSGWCLSRGGGWCLGWSSRLSFGCCRNWCLSCRSGSWRYRSCRNRRFCICCRTIACMIKFVLLQKKREGRHSPPQWILGTFQELTSAWVWPQANFFPFSLSSSLMAH